MSVSVKITGLDKLQRELEEVQRAFKSLDGTIATLKFSPSDPVSVQNAIRQMEDAVDKKAARYSGNALIANVAKATKEQFRKRILELAKSKA